MNICREGSTVVGNMECTGLVGLCPRLLDVWCAELWLDNLSFQPVCLPMASP
jgi:hypothetical protein